MYSVFYFNLNEADLNKTIGKVLFSNRIFKFHFFYLNYITNEITEITKRELFFQCIHAWPFLWLLLVLGNNFLYSEIKCCWIRNSGTEHIKFFSSRSSWLVIEFDVGGRDFSAFTCCVLANKLLALFWADITSANVFSSLTFKLLQLFIWSVRSVANWSKLVILFRAFSLILCFASCCFTSSVMSWQSFVAFAASPDLSFANKNNWKKTKKN